MSMDRHQVDWLLAACLLCTAASSFVRAAHSTHCFIHVMCTDFRRLCATGIQRDTDEAAAAFLCARDAQCAFGKMKIFGLRIHTWQQMPPACRSRVKSGPSAHTSTRVSCVKFDLYKENWLYVEKVFKIAESSRNYPQQD
jgi:hypothetical protein